MVLEIVNTFFRTFILQLLNFLPQFLVKYSFDVVFELASIQEIVSFGNSDDLDSIEEATKLAYRMEYFSKRKDCDGVIHESSLHIVHGYLV